MNFESKLPKGVFIATLTPMHKDLSVNHEALVAHIKYLLNNGSDGICLLGTTGEANSLSLKERIEIIDSVVNAGIDPVKLLIGTGCCAFPDTVALTKYAVSKGAGGILMLPPFFYKNLSDYGVVDYFKLITDKVNDKNLKIYLYHFPKMTGVPFTLSLTKKLINALPNTIVGMKDSSGDWSNTETIQKGIPGFKMYPGSETFLLDSLRLGGMGCISATGNATVKLIAEVYKNWENENADALQEDLIKVRKAFEVTAFASGLKYLFSEWTNNSEWLNVRPPNALPNKDEEEKLITNLKEVGFTLE